VNVRPAAAAWGRIYEDGSLPVYPLRRSICRVVVPWSIPTLGFFIQIVGESAEFIGNIRCAQSEIAQGSSRVAEKHSHVFSHDPD
jgi:hypothetical protein